MSTFHQRKQERVQRAALPTIKCVACNGSGRYDHNGSPPCGCCEGTGKERAEIPMTHPDFRERYWLLLADKQRRKLERIEASRQTPGGG